MPRAPPRVFEPRPAPQMPAQIPTEQQRFVDAFRSLDERSQMRDADRESRPAPQMPAQMPTEQPRVRPRGQILERSRMMAEDRQSGARRDFEAEQEREVRERGEMVMADVESYVEPDETMDGYRYEEIDFAPVREALRQQRRQREEERKMKLLIQQQEREMELLIREQERKQMLEERQLQQLLDDAGELVEGADDRDLGDFDPDRYERGRDFDRERDFE